MRAGLGVGGRGRSGLTGEERKRQETIKGWMGESKSESEDGVTSECKIAR